MEIIYLHLTSVIDPKSEHVADLYIGHPIVINMFKYLNTIYQHCAYRKSSSNYLIIWQFTMNNNLVIQCDCSYLFLKCRSWIQTRCDEWIIKYLLLFGFRLSRGRHCCQICEACWRAFAAWWSMIIYLVVQWLSVVYVTTTVLEHTNCLCSCAVRGVSFHASFSYHRRRYFYNPVVHLFPVTLYYLLNKIWWE